MPYDTLNCIVVMKFVTRSWIYFGKSYAFVI